MRRKKAEGSTASGGGRLTPGDIQQVEFRLAFRGYNERDVDAFLDRITEDLSAYIEENQRLRAGSAPAGAPMPDLGTTRDEAERILADAREEAARIVRDAETRAAAIGAAGGDPRSAVAPFLTSEREFLQRLGSLVQGHAEDVKRMVGQMRSTADRPGPAEAPAPSQPPTEPEATAAEAPAEAPAESEPAAEPEPGATTTDEAFAPISVPPADDADQAEPDEPTPQPAQAQLRRDSGERSLRELFWGED